MTEEMKMILEKLSEMDKKITDIQLTLENETDALKVENEKDMLLIRVNRMENELRRLKERIDAIA